MLNKYLILVFFIFFSINSIYANNYTVDIYFTVPDGVYVTNERIELKGYVSLANYTNNGTLVLSSSVLANASVNLSMRNSTNYISEYSLTTDSNGTFYSRSSFYTNATEINASSIPGSYILRAEYKDPNNFSWFSEVGFKVVNQSINLIRVNSEKAKYYPSENINIEVEAIKMIGDKILRIANVSSNGTLRNSSKGILNTFNCITGDNGRCNVNVTAPSDYGIYILELNNFKSFSTFFISPFSVNVYMKDELGKSLKNIYAIGEQGKVEVGVANASSTDIYTFSGYIADSSGNVVKSISSTQLNNNNSFT